MHNYQYCLVDISRRNMRFRLHTPEIGMQSMGKTVELEIPKQFFSPQHQLVYVLTCVTNIGWDLVEVMNDDQILFRRVIA